MCLRVLKESNKSRFDRYMYSRQKQCIDHTSYYLSGLSRAPASFPVVLGDFGCDVTQDVTCQACRENSRYRAGFQAFSGHSDSANRPGYEAARAHFSDNLSRNSCIRRCRSLNDS